MNPLTKNHMKEVEHAIKWAGEVVKTGVQIVPIMFMFRDPRDGETEGKIHILPMAWQSDEGKEEAMRVARQVAKMTKADLVIFVTEAWTIHADHYADKTRPVSEHPRRREVVTVYAQSDRGTLFGCAPILRSGPTPRLGDMEWGDSASGRMTRILPDAPANNSHLN